MNIQQALNQSLLSIAGSAYLTGETLERGKQSAIANYQAASKERNESAKQEQIVSAVQDDDWNEQFAKDVKKKAMTQAEVDEIVKADPKIISAKERKVMADARFKRAEGNLDKWVVDPNEAKNYKKIAEADNWNMLNSLLTDVPAARAEAKALRSLTNKQETYASQDEAKQERPKILSGTYKSRMHQPSVRMEE